VVLRIKETNKVMEVYVGDFECGSLVNHINRKPTVGPSCCLAALAASVPS
jgi:hypothetical protein